jgi:eukaryotic-like serine/threonine-protein kinase
LEFRETVAARGVDGREAIVTDEQWREAWDIFEAAGQLPAHQRRTFLEESSADPEIVRNVRTMLEDAESPGSLPLGGSRIGSRVGRYSVTGLLGRGGLGEVYSARDGELDRSVALKLLAPESQGGPLQVERFIREAKALSAINHPNIVTVYEVVTFDAGVAIVMELVEGTALRKLATTSLSADQIRGIIHRDVKPENIMVRRDGYVKVLDFGLARDLASWDQRSLAGLPIGTLRYMSPEQSRVEPLSGASDVFSLGLVLFELATGRHPFPADSPFETVLAITTKAPSPPSKLNASIPQGLEDLILSTIEKDCLLRPTAEAVAEALGDIIRPPKGRTHLTPVPKQLAASKRSLRLAIVAGSLVVASVVGWFLSNKAPPPEMTELRSYPLTSQVGWEGSPALSPDGEWVAFSWTERLDFPRQIYVKRLDADAPTRLTDSASGGNIGPLVWSPDAKRIAFKRCFGQPGGIYLMAKEGGDEKKVVELSNSNPSSSIDWSPDGTQMAFSDASPASDQLSIYLFNLQTGEKRKLTAPPPQVWGDWDPKFSPDGETVAFKRVTEYWADDIYLVPTVGAMPGCQTVEIWFCRASEAAASLGYGDRH